MTCLSRLAVASLLAASVATAADNENTRRSLKGLKGINVLVEPVKAEVEQGGLTKTSIQTDVELKLRQAGITVLTEAESLAAPGSPYLYISVGTVGSGPLSAYATHVELAQSVRLDRDPGIWLAGATTWSVASVGTVGRDNLREIRDDIKDNVDQFINAYLSVNPKK
jgi:hypothetical protein